MNDRLILSIFVILVSMSFVSAISVESVFVETLKPGNTADISIVLENVFNEKVENVVVELDVSDLPLNLVGTSSFTVNEIDEDDDEEFSFVIRAASTAEPGEYQIPYSITYEIDNDQFVRESSIGVRITADSLVDFTTSIESPIIGTQGAIELTVINKGLGELRFTSVEIDPRGFTLLSDKEVYIGDIDSDDFEIATFNVIFNRQQTSVEATVEYRDVENRVIREQITLPIKIYSREKALELGIIQKSKSLIYMGTIVIAIALFFVIRAIRKRNRHLSSLRS